MAFGGHVGLSFMWGYLGLEVFFSELAIIRKCNFFSWICQEDILLGGGDWG